MADLEEILSSDSLFPARLPSGEGILPYQEIHHLISTGKIRSNAEIGEEQVQPSSIDLRLSHVAYRVSASFLPGRSTDLITKAKANGILKERIDISGPTRLEPNVIYIIPLMESLALPSDLYGIANPKSTTGRLDIFTRLITEHGDEFDRVRRNYSGSLYIEMISQTFPIIVQAGMKLNQLRFARGRLAPAGDGRLNELHQGESLLGADEDSGQSNINRGLRFTVDLQGNGSGVVAYQAKKSSVAIDLSKIDYYEAADFWIPIPRSENLQFVLEPNEFYILASKQRVRVPPDFAAEMLPYDLATQEFRVHYAGFFDPGFGYGMDGMVPGTRAVLEVRASHMPILLEDDQFVGRLNYYKMSTKPEIAYGGNIGSSYQQQGLALSKQFKRETQCISSSASIAFATSEEGRSTANDPSGTNLRLADSDDDDYGPAANLTFPGTGSEQRLNAKNR